MIIGIKEVEIQTILRILYEYCHMNNTKWFISIIKMSASETNKNKPLSFEIFEHVYLAS